MPSNFKQKSIQQHQYLWSIPQICLASGFVGPMAGCYFLGKNFHQLGSPGSAKKCYLVGVIGSFLSLAIFSLIPESLLAYIPPISISAAILSVTLSYANLYQKQLIQDSFDQGAKRFSYLWWILMLITFAVIQLPLFIFYTFLIAIIF